MESSYSEREDITSGVPQISILGPLSFNIFLCDLFLEDEFNYFANYADDTTPYFVGSTTAEVLKNLSCLNRKLFSWFANNQMIPKDDKCHLVLSSPEEDAAIEIEEPRLSSPEEDAAIQIKESKIKRSKVKKLLGIHIDYKFKFDTHVDTICKKAHRRLTALSRITNYMELPKRRILMNAFFKAEFNYCPIIWMFHSRSLNNKINRLHERCLSCIICGILRSFLQIQFIVFITELNQHRIWDQRFGSKYLQKLKIRNPLMGLKEKSKNGNPLIVHVEFVRHLYLI